MILTSIHSENSDCWREGAVYVCTWSSNELQGLSPREGKSAAHAVFRALVSSGVCSLHTRLTKLFLTPADVEKYARGPHVPGKKHW